MPWVRIKDTKIVYDWCRENFGPQGGGSTIIRWWLTEDNAYFTHEEDATLFALRWSK